MFARHASWQHPFEDRVVSPFDVAGNTPAVAVEEARIGLMMLIATGERALETFETVADRPDPEFVAELELTLARAREELEILRVRSLLP